MPTPAEELKTAALTGIKNRSEAPLLPVPPFQFEPLPPELVKAFPSAAVWLRSQNVRLIEHSRKTNVSLGR